MPKVINFNDFKYETIKLPKGQEYIIITDKKHTPGYALHTDLIVTSLVEINLDKIEWHIETIDYKTIPKLSECKDLKDFYISQATSARLYYQDSVFYIETRKNPIYLKDLENLLNRKSDFKLNYTYYYNGPRVIGNYDCEKCRWFNDHFDDWRVTASIDGYIVQLSFHYSKLSKIMNQI